MRDPLVETAKPCRKPDTRLAAPIPIISWLGSISSPRRAPKLEEVAIVSANETSVMPSAAAINGPTSEKLVHGSDGVGKPRGREPTVATPCCCSSKTAETTVATTMPTSTAGSTLVKRGSTSRMARTTSPTARAAPTVPSRPVKNALTSGPNSSASVEKPKSFGSWPTMMTMAKPFM